MVYFAANFLFEMRSFSLFVLADFHDILASVELLQENTAK